MRRGGEEAGGAEAGLPDGLQPGPGALATRHSLSLSSSVPASLAAQTPGPLISAHIHASVSSLKGSGAFRRSASPPLPHPFCFPTSRLADLRPFSSNHINRTCEYRVSNCQFLISGKFNH